jgi:hypothetical protein
MLSLPWVLLCLLLAFHAYREYWYRRSMLASAECGQGMNDSLSILQTEGTNHFISLEQPDAIRAIHQGA